jgi:pimeloyl-ACP methyl ester carboxylesterase
VRALLDLVAIGMVAVCGSGCALLPLNASHASPAPVEGITFVADGSGDLRQVSDALAKVAQDAHSPMRVQRVQWSHAKGAVFPDLYDNGHHQAQGQSLANQIIAYRQANPASRICLVGYSSGASVALAAAERLPPETLDRLILISPSLAARHDLRPSLRASREGIDNFYSEWDAICLVLGAMGTGDGAGQAVAGHTGFVPVGEKEEDKQLYHGLRQHAWHGANSWSGHDGGHFGCFKPAFLRDMVLPLVLGGNIIKA